MGAGAANRLAIARTQSASSPCALREDRRAHEDSLLSELGFLPAAGKELFNEVTQCHTLLLDRVLHVLKPMGFLGATACVGAYEAVLVVVTVRC